MAQLINKTVLNRIIPENKVSITTFESNLRNKIDDNNHKYDQILEKINQFLENDNWKYVNSFVNIEKHRKLLDYIAHQEYRNTNIVFQFNEFQYNGNDFSKEKILTVLEEKISFFTEWIEKMIEEIVNYYSLQEYAFL